MLRIRLARFGAKKRPHYHIVVANAEAPRDGRFLEQVGTYNPQHPIERQSIALDRVDHWISMGAQPTERVRKILSAYRNAKKAA
ncbi:MAG: 30S ribosomal protein S16 [Deltaproteobacteria bacterium]|nr:30S ribosomal protein S16 [Sandaracinaceae bacterium]MCX7808044.1 30S ribosomal protein S16 [Deltaproteobacteria bacterium]MDW8247449.1 30S ribosomal protein S16 [Sandaracinaceae bacterium]